VQYELIIRNGSIVTDGGVARLSIGVSDGLIATLEPEISGDAREEVDASGLHVLPGVIDAHVHFNEPGRTEWEGFATGSAALAAGGGSCFFDMPLNASPPTLDSESFDLKRRAAEARSVTDFGLWGGIVPGNLDRLEDLAERGVVGFKAFMSASGIEDFESVDDRALHDGMARAAGLGLPVAVHAEDEAITTGLVVQAKAEGRRGVRDFLNSRPIVAELEAIRRAVVLAEETGCSLHVVHVSTAAGVAIITEARARGVDVTCETCPHYLVFSEEDVERLGAVAKCAPPVRSREEVEKLWDRLGHGEIDLIASDHSPSPLSMKTSPNFFEVWGGIAGCQSTLPAMLVEGHLERGMPLRDIARMLSLAPARRFGIERKGRIAVGYDADLVIADLSAGDELKAEHLLYRHPISPYVGRRLHGLVRRTLVRGQSVFADGAPTGARAAHLVRPARPSEITR
jgi:allantoinase